MAIPVFSAASTHQSSTSEQPSNVKSHQMGSSFQYSHHPLFSNAIPEVPSQVQRTTASGEVSPTSTSRGLSGHSSINAESSARSVFGLAGSSGSLPATVRVFQTSKHVITSNKYTTSADPRGFIPVYEYYLTGPIAPVSAASSASSSSDVTTTKEPELMMIDSENGFVLWTSIWKALGHSKADVSKIRDSAPEGLDMEGRVKKVTGGTLKIQGTWLSFDIALILARKTAYTIAEDLIPIFGPTFPASCLLPGQLGYGQALLSAPKASARRRRQASKSGTSNQLDASPLSHASNGIPQPSIKQRPGPYVRTLSFESKNQLASSSTQSKPISAPPLGSHSQHTSQPGNPLHFSTSVPSLYPQHQSHHLIPSSSQSQFYLHRGNDPTPSPLSPGAPMPSELGMPSFGSSTYRSHSFSTIVNNDRNHGSFSLPARSSFSAVSPNSNNLSHPQHASPLPPMSSFLTGPGEGDDPVSVLRRLKLESDEVVGRRRSSGSDNNSGNSLHVSLSSGPSTSSPLDPTIQFNQQWASAARSTTDVSSNSDGSELVGGGQMSEDEDNHKMGGDVFGIQSRSSSASNIAQQHYDAPRRPW